MTRMARAASCAWTRSFGGAVHWLLKVQGTAHRRATHEDLVRECCPTVSTRRVLGALLRGSAVERAHQVSRRADSRTAPCSLLEAAARSLLWLNTGGRGSPAGSTPRRLH